MDVLRAFSLRDYMLNSVAYYRARPSAFRDEVCVEAEGLSTRA